MLNFLIAVAIIIGGLYVIRAFSKAAPGQSKGLTRKIGGAVCIGLAALLAVKGSMTAAAPLLLFGLGLFAPDFHFPWSNKAAGQVARVTTAMLAMELEHNSGRMDGIVLQGLLKGKRISALSDSELKALLQECRGVPDQSEALLCAWLDRTKPGWSNRWGSDPTQRRANSRTRMTRDEAFSVLGLKPGAGADEIRAAHRRLMKDFHPDKGGSDYLASKINEAKDALIQD